MLIDCLALFGSVPKQFILTGASFCPFTGVGGALEKNGHVAAVYY